MRRLLRSAAVLLVILGSQAQAVEPSVSLARAFEDVDPAAVPSGILLDRVMELADLSRFDGTPNSTAATPAALRQVLHQIRRASFLPLAGPDPDALRSRGFDVADGDVVPIAVVDARAHRIRAGALEDGTARLEGERVRLEAGALEEVRVFAAAPLTDETRRGESMSFVLPADLWISQGVERPRRLEMDAGDGRGFRPVEFGIPFTPAWFGEGRREVTIRAHGSGGETRVARFAFQVLRMGTPMPSDTLFVTASVPYSGAAASGKAYLYLAPGHVAVENPVVISEGFDLDDSMTWERLYELLNQENLLEDLRTEGFDTIVLDFDSATEPIQRNGYLVAEVLQQVAAMIDPAHEIFLVGPSMGGLCTRWALAWLESQSIDPRVRTWLSFDAPHHGASIPLGIQYWLDFFSEESADSEFLLSRLDTPAARQMLTYHHTTPPSSSPSADPLRAQLLADFASLGDWPTSARRIAAANGSGAGQDQGFAPGAQIIQWVYRNFLVDIDGNVWAVPNGGSAQVFFGRIDPIFFPADQQTVVVSGTSPYDNAPGGSRNSMFQMDTTAAPYGDIVALHPSHCFIPTISALALDTSDLFYDVDGTPDLLSHTPFAALLWADGNEEHVHISAATKAWVMAEVLAGPTAAPDLAASGRGEASLVMRGAVPNPSRGAVDLQFALRQPAPVTLDAFDVAGRRIARLLDAVPMPAGEHALRWTPPAAGVWYWRVGTPSEQAAGRAITVE